jgi:hypothetical protein
MKTLTQEQIIEIAEELDCGFRSFWNKTNGELLFIPNELKFPGMDIEAWSEEIEKLDANFSDYVEIESMQSYESFEIMVDFVETIPDSNKLKDRLMYALNKKKPFREFKFVIDNSGDYRQKWFDFKNENLQKWVLNQFNEKVSNEE